MLLPLLERLQDRVVDAAHGELPRRLQLLPRARRAARGARAAAGPGAAGGLRSIEAACRRGARGRRPRLRLEPVGFLELLGLQADFVRLQGRLVLLPQARLVGLARQVGKALLRGVVLVTEQLRRRRPHERRELRRRGDLRRRADGADGGGGADGAVVGRGRVQFSLRQEHVELFQDAPRGAVAALNHKLDQLIVDGGALEALQDLLDLLPVVQAAGDGGPGVEAVHAHVAVVAAEDLGDDEAVHEVAPRVVHGEAQIERLDPLDDFALHGSRERFESHKLAVMYTHGRRVRKAFTPPSTKIALRSEQG
mmetsp:Transcript_11402/g.35433  ORF Transcript_11402/g.35433 Transcript_11402/m.35433 type:complete len:309 (+) Transcript_11402:1840-2766(+)